VGDLKRTLAEVPIVKDEPLIALDLCEALSAAAASIIAATSVSDALRLTWQADISAGVVDVELGTDDCDRVCHSFSEEIPFVFYAAYSEPLVRPQRPTVPAIANAGDMLLIVEASHGAQLPQHLSPTGPPEPARDANGRVPFRWKLRSASKETNSCGESCFQKEISGRIGLPVLNRIAQALAAYWDALVNAPAEERWTDLIKRLDEQEQAKVMPPDYGQTSLPEGKPNPSMEKGFRHDRRISHQSPDGGQRLGRQARWHGRRSGGEAR
jgi:hypothetical protein